MISNPHWSLEQPAPHPSTDSYIVECATCGYEPEEQLLIRPVRCPKCHCFTWHRIPRPGMLAGRMVGVPVHHLHATYLS